MYRCQEYTEVVVAPTRAVATVVYFRPPLLCLIKTQLSRLVSPEFIVFSYLRLLGINNIGRKKRASNWCVFNCMRAFRFRLQFFSSLLPPSLSPSHPSQPNCVVWKFSGYTELLLPGFGVCLSFLPTALPPLPRQGNGSVLTAYCPHLQEVEEDKRNVRHW